MILDVSDSAFRKVFDDMELSLPKKWDGKDFVSELKILFQAYMDNLIEANKQRSESDEDHYVTFERILDITRLLIQTVEEYLNGFPATAYESFSRMMDILTVMPLEDTSLEDSSEMYEDPITLYRVTREKKDQTIERMFHTPYTLRHKISTCRYSIAGFPCLYLGTTLELCCKEIRETAKDSVLASAFRTDDVKLFVQRLRVYDLSIRPQDYLAVENEAFPKPIISFDLLRDRKRRFAYLLWYPLIAASSFIRAYPDDAFAAEYIIPQLLMQWIRQNKPITQTNEIIGIRYFSCASEDAADIGYNYVFPTSGKKDSIMQCFCMFLVKVFSLTKPVFVHDYKNKKECELFLKSQKFYKIGGPDDNLIK